MTDQKSLWSALGLAAIGIVVIFALTSDRPGKTLEVPKEASTERQQADRNPAPDTQTQPALAPSPSPTIVTEGSTIFVHTLHRLSFTLPDAYTVESSQYGVTDASKAENFSVRRKDFEAGSSAPRLDVYTNLSLAPNQTIQQFAEAIYTINRTNNHATTPLATERYGNALAYVFGLKAGYTDQNGGQTVNSDGGKVIFLERNGKIFRVLQTGSDPELTKLMGSLAFK